MPAINFPDSPSNGALYSAGGKNWSYNGTAWILQGVIPVIPDGSISHSQLASDAVTTAKIANSAVTVSKIESNPTFVGTVTLPSTTSIGNVSATEIGYIDGVTSAIQTQMDTKSPSASPTFTGTVVLPSNTSIGNVSSIEIGYVDGVTSAIQTQLNDKAPLANPTFTGTVSGVSKSMVGLGSVDNTADTAKPVSTAQQTALNLKANLASPTFTGEVSGSGRITQTNARGNVWLGDWTGGSAYGGVGGTNAFLLMSHASDTNSYLINNNGGISLRTAGLDRINASSTGWVTTPYNPAFSALNVNAASGGQDLVFATTSVNAGSCYNTSNGRFTAPIAGSYWFAYNTLQQNGNTGEYRHALFKNGSGYGGLRFIFFKDAAGWQSTYAYGVVYLAANDYVTLRYESGAGVMYTDGNYSNFSGYLIG